MPAFYRGNSDGVIGAPARVLIAAATYPVPTKLANILNLSTYDAIAATYGWQDVGLTSEPASVSYGVSMTAWNNQQFGEFLRQPDQWTGQVGTTFMETTQEKKNLLLHATTPADSDTDEHRTNFPAHLSIPTVRLCVAHIDRFGKIHASVFPRAQWNGDNIAQSIARNAALVIPMTWAIYPDEDVVDSETGLPLLRYDFDQYDS